MTEQEILISDFLYDEIAYCYCNNCKFAKMSESEAREEYDTYPCENCHRKYMGWGISKETCDKLARDIVKKLKVEQ